MTSHSRTRLGDAHRTRSWIALGVALAVVLTLAGSFSSTSPSVHAASSDPSPAVATAVPTAVATEGLGEVTGEVEWQECPFPPPSGITIECGALNVPADRDDPGSDVVRLRFGIVRATDGDSTNGEAPAPETPIVYLSGGPGQASLELIPVAFGRIYGPLARDRDLIILDQRGTGLSQPSLFCDEYVTWATESLDSESTPEEQAEQAAQALGDCRQRLLDDGVDLADFDSRASAADLEDLRVALGYEEWDLYGLSYGTRLALTAMRTHPEGIRAVVLDAAYPVEADLYAETPANVARAIEAFYGSCASDAGCSAQFPDLEETFRDLVDELNEEPASIIVFDPNTGQQHPGLLTGDALVGFLFQSLYVTDLIQFLPEIIHAAADDEFATIGLMQGSFLSELAYVSMGQQLAVQCNEEIAFAEEGQLVEAAAEYPLFEGFFTSAPTLGPKLIELCDAWADAGEAEPIENEAVTSEIPTLIMTGELDPITPPRWGEAVAEKLASATFHEFPHTGHGVLPARDCAASMVEAFLDDPAAEVDAGCIEAIAAPAFTAADVDVEMVPFTSPSGFEGLRPEAWDEVLPGIFQESPLVALIQQVIPGATEQVFLQQVAAQLGLSEPPQPVAQIEGSRATWNVYELQNLGQEIAVAIVEHEGDLLVVQLATPPLRHEPYYDLAFVPAVEAFETGTTPPSASASTSPATDNAGE